MRKKPFDIDEVFRALRAATAPSARAALFELRDQGYTSAFEQLAACILSVRTRDETMLPVARRLFERARTPAALEAVLPERYHVEINERLSPSASTCAPAARRSAPPARCWSSAAR